MLLVQLPHLKNHNLEKWCFSRCLHWEVKYAYIVLKICQHLWFHLWIGECKGNDSFCSQICTCDIEMVCKRANCPSMQWVVDTPVSSATLERVGTCRSSIENPLAHDKHANILLQKHKQTSCILKQNSPSENSKKKGRKAVFCQPVPPK